MRKLALSFLIGASALAACSAASDKAAPGAPPSNGPRPNAGGAAGEASINVEGGAGPDLQLSVGGAPPATEQPGPMRAPNPGSRSATFGQVPTDIVQRFKDATESRDAGPRLVYPTPQTMFPPDLARILFQWRGAGDYFRLRFTFPENTFDVYTDGKHADCDKAGTPVGADGRCWESSSDDLGLDFAYELGATFSVEVTALDAAAGAQARVGTKAQLHVGPQPTIGAIYYWSTTTKGVRRATLGGRQPADYLTPTTGLSAAQAAQLTTTDATNRCVACHTLSRSGKKMMVSLNGDQLGVVDVTDALPPPFSYASKSSGAYGSDAIVPASWATFGPGDKRIITAGNGMLELRDISAAHQAPVVTDIAAPSAGGVDYRASMPDWSPDGRHVVFTATDASLPTANQARHLRGSSIASLEVQGDQFGKFQLLFESKGVLRQDCIDNAGPGGPGRESYANPMFSPDSRWLLFARADCESERDSTAEILLSAAEPGGSVDHLHRANSAVGDAELQNLTNAMPTWGPVLDQDTKIAWIAFTSTRDFGFVLAQNSGWLTDIGYPVRQLWVAAIDVSKLGTGEDPSFPAFRLPAQDYGENNHRPFWTYDALPPNFMRSDPPVK